MAERTIPTIDADGRPICWPLFARFKAAGGGVSFSGWEGHWPGGLPGARFPTAEAALDDTEARWLRVEAMRRRKMQTEVVELHDGPEVQYLAPGVAAVPLTARQLATEAARRDARRGDALPPAGGLFDDVARAQTDMFS